MGNMIIKGSIEHIDECAEILINSDIGQTYFKNLENARESIIEGISDGEFYISLEPLGQECRGFVWFRWNAMFYRYPYIHMIVVEEEQRGKGIGKALMGFVENVVFVKYSKIFLFVDSHNQHARAFYKGLEYEEVGSLEGLFKSGITSKIMMKKRPI